MPSKIRSGGGLQWFVTVAALLAMTRLASAQVVIFGKELIGFSPKEFEYGVTGEGGPGRWEVQRDHTATRGKALTQLTINPAEYRFLVAIYNPVVAGNVEVTTRCKPVSGKVDHAVRPSRNSNTSVAVELMMKGTEMKIRKVIASFVVFLGIGMVHALAEPAKPSGGQVSVWSGVYTTAQNERGQEVHEGFCAQCHGPKLNGAGQPDQPPSPAIAGETFLRKWTGRPLAALFEYVKTKMPPDTPGTLTDQQSIDAIAHILAVSDMPAGGKDLPPDPNALANIVMEDKPK